MFSGLSIQLLFFPDSISDEDFAPKQPKAPALPKVSVNSSAEDIKRAFEAVSKHGSSSNSSSVGTSSDAASAGVGSSSGTTGSVQ